MKKTALCLSLSLMWLVSCQTTTTPVQPSPSPTATPTPVASPVFQGETTLMGKVSLDAQSVVVEAANASGTFRKSVNVSNGQYRITGVPVGERIRLQAQYRNNEHVILSALTDIPTSQKDQETELNITLESTATELIYAYAGDKGMTAITGLKVSDFEANTALNTYRNQVLSVLQGIFATAIDAIQVTVPTAPSVTSALMTAVPAINAILQSQPIPSATPTPSTSPSTAPSTSPSTAPTAFVPTRLLIKPGASVRIARNTDLRLWVVGVDAANNQKVMQANWVQLEKDGQGNIDANGVFTPLSKGTFKYAAQVGNLSSNITIQVTDGELDSLELIPDQDFTLDVGQEFELQAKGKDDLGNEVVVTPTWELSNEFVGKVDENGVFSPLQAGRVDVTARARGLSATLEITVESNSAFLIEVSPDQPTVLTGRSQPIQILALDLANNTTATAFNFSVQDSAIGSFASQDTSINGIVPTAVFQAKSPGTTQVTVRDVLSNRTLSFPITVADSVPYIANISPADTPLLPGQTVVLTGENFSPVASANQVLFNGLPGNVIAATTNSLTVTVPVGAFTGFVTVTSEGKKGNGFPFVITPRLDNVIPSEADEGDLVTITGQYFATDNPAHNVVYFDSERASVPINVTTSSMQVRVPGNLSADVNVSVRVKGQLSNFQDFTVAGASLPSWSEKDAAPTSRTAARAETINGSIYVIGGLQDSNSDRLEIYDIGEDSWSIGENLPDKLNELTTAELDNKLYVFGGNSAYVYDPDFDSWDQLKNMDYSHEGAVAEEYRGKIYVIGGKGSVGRVIEEYDPDSDTWVTMQNSPSRRYAAASATYNGRIYVIGGGEDEAEDRITAYDIDQDEWIVGLTPMPKRLRWAGATILNNKIYVVGGEDENGQESDAVYEYDPVADHWRTMRRLPSARKGPAVAGISSRIHVIGGDNSRSDTTNTNFRGAF